MLHRLAVYPTALALAWVGVLYATSGASSFSAIRLFLVTILFAVAITVVTTLALRDRDRGGLAAAGLIAAILLGALALQAALALSLVLIVVLEAVLSARQGARRSWTLATSLGNAIGAVAILAAVFLGIGESVPARIGRDWETEGPLRPGPTAAPAGDLPDIYLILLDGYERPDKYGELFGVDDSGFVSELDRRGFEIAAQSRSNYLQTDLSLASMFNMRHVIGVGDPSLGETMRLRRMIEENEFLRYLDGAGYRTESVSSGYETVAMRTVDRFIDTGQLNELEIVAIWKSGVGNLLSWLAPDFLADDARSRVTAILERTAQVAESPREAPTFVFAHVPSPHPPFVFDASGAHARACVCPTGGMEPNVPYSDDDYIAAYVGQVAYVNQLVLGAIDRIQAATNGKAIVALFSDHGSASGWDWADVEHSNFDERSANLMAIAWPDGRSRLEDDATLVNFLSPILAESLGIDVAHQSDTIYRPSGPSVFDLVPVEVSGPGP